MLLRIVILFTFSLLIAVSAQAQTIESLVLKKVNHLRDSLNLNTLSADLVLKNAAKDHAFYIQSIDKLTHYQQTFSKETPAERIVFYGGNRTYSGENVAYVPASYQYKKVLDIEKTAQQLFTAWLNSPPHYQNLIHPEFKRMGLGFSVSKSGKVYSAQVFSSNEILLPSAFKNSDISWGVRPAEFTCKDEPQTYETMFFANYVQTYNNEIYLFFHDKAFFNKVIQNENDGIAIDIVLREQLPCEKENQFHISEVHDGEMQRPVYKYDLIRNNVSGNPNKLEVKIGDVPAYLKNKQWQVNLIVINDNKYCDYSYPVDIPSDIYPLLKVTPTYDTLNWKDSVFVEHPASVVIKDTLLTEIAYLKNEENFNTISYQKFNQMLLWGPFVKSIRVDCFASVEGATWYNEKLLKGRKKTVTELLNKYGFPSNIVTIKTGENWDKMYEQIEHHNLSNLSKATKKEVKKYLKETSSQHLDSLLYEQRKTQVQTIVDTCIDVTTGAAYMFASYFDSTLSIENLNWNEHLREDYIKKELPIQIELVDTLKHKRYLKTNLLGAVTIDNRSGQLDSALVMDLCKKIDPKNSKQVFNYGIFLTQYWFSKFSRNHSFRRVAPTIAPTMLQSMLKNIDTSLVDTEELIRLKVNILLSGIHYFVAHNDWHMVTTYFNSISKLVRQGKFSPQEAHELALFCNHFHKFKIAVNLLDPFFTEGKLSENAYFTLAKTATLIRKDLDSNRYHAYMNKAKKINPKRYCKWLDSSFQIQRDEYLKKDFCNSCN